MTNLDVMDQAGGSSISATGSINSGNTGANWTFSAPCAPTPTPTPNLTRTISGRVRTGTGAGIVNVKVVLTGAETRQSYTNPDGSYAFRSLTPGLNYTVTPLQTQTLSFNPQNRTLNNLTVDQTADFAATSNTLTIRGHLVSDGTAGIAVTKRAPCCCA